MGGAGDAAGFSDLRKKLDIMGYHQTLPALGVPLVAAMFGDLIKTTESLRDAKKEIMTLLEEKMCWEQGVEPYKCDNTRLITECNELHITLLKQSEETDVKIRAYQKKLQQLETAKADCEARCLELQRSLEMFTSRQMTISSKRLSSKSKQPFITTVRSGDQLPPLPDGVSLSRCKCKASSENSVGVSEQTERNKLQKSVADLSDELDFYKRKVDTRNREICRLNELLSGGRPLTALAKDCCYKELQALKQDVDILQREKLEFSSQMREQQNEAAGYRKECLDLEQKLKTLQTELDELKIAALQVETQANEEVATRDDEIRLLKTKLAKLEKPQAKKDERSSAGAEKSSLQESLNKSMQREADLKQENEKLAKKLHKLHVKLNELKKSTKEQPKPADEELKHLQAERDFFEKEFRRLTSERDSTTELAQLQAQLRLKEDELRHYRAQPQSTSVSRTSSASTGTVTSTYSSSTMQSDCVQAVINRVERERDCARNELERVRCERDALREKHLALSQLHAEELKAVRERSEKLYDRVTHLERENRDLLTAKIPADTHMALLREELAHTRQRFDQLQEENKKLQQQNESHRAAQEESLRSLNTLKYQLVRTERQLQITENRLTAIDTGKDTRSEEIAKLRSEINALKQSYANLKNEKESVDFQFEVKTDRVKQLEEDLKNSTIKQKDLEHDIEILEEQLQHFTRKTKDRESALTESSETCKSLREQILALKASRDNSIKENSRLSNDLAESRADVHNTKRKLRDTEQEVERMKQQLHQYVQEIKKTEDLLLEKERDREEILEHYRNLSLDAVALEGSKQTLEASSAECKRKVAELEAEVAKLKRDTRGKDERICELEDKLKKSSDMKAQLQHQLDDAHDSLRKLRAELAAHKELCDKLDDEKCKLKAEIHELNVQRRNLEGDIEKLRVELKKTEADKQVYTQTMGDLINETRHDLVGQIAADSKLTQELSRLRRQNEEILQQLEKSNRDFEIERKLREQLEQQKAELRSNLDDNLYLQARHTEQSAHLHADTL